MNPSIPTRRVRCPRCKAAPTVLVEEWSGAAIEFVYDGTARSSEGVKTDPWPRSVHARCACGHYWKLPGVAQITNLDLPVQVEPTTTSR